MKEIVNRLHESRQVDIAKSILEDAGYKVTKGRKVNEGLSYADDDYAGSLESEGTFDQVDTGEPDENLDAVIDDASRKVGTDVRKFEFYPDTNISGPEDLVGEWSEIGGLTYQEGGYYSSVIMKDTRGQYLVIIGNRDAYQFALLGKKSGMRESRKVRGRKLK